MLLEPDTPLGTFVSQVSSGTTVPLLQFTPTWAKFGSSHSVRLLLGGGKEGKVDIAGRGVCLSSVS